MDTIAKRPNPSKKREAYLMILYTVFILFWLYSAGSKLYDFDTFKQEMHSQVFPNGISNLLSYAIPAFEIMIAGLLVYSTTRLLGMTLSFLLMLMFTAYVGLALLDAYRFMPCNCIGLLGQHASWGANFILNLFIVIVAAIGLILTFKHRERRKEKDMNV
ncbi:hypothetical protein SAMN05421820_101796 [Pedobacter steynii]|uniref:Methylamine utilisation protein MauE domain-containing protein n=1 Tax=Pedobacter steynii TaxID=430522 RepID=A0A1G9L6Y0_9SPHI|nr:MauE/DoxX family redox-associated membrane protein [Pedobacter steynii]NQX38763.1 hypothetical protein [Pedobacter steynii]SDL57720.1 hypothetical protein SAMN05421820_101796 [Pedobacter steynii]